MWSVGNSNGQFRRAGTWHYVDQLSWVAGNHNVKVGGEFRYVYENGYDAFGSRPLVDFTAFGNFGIPVVNCPGRCASDEVLQTLSAALLGVPGIQSQTQFFSAQGQRTATDYRRFVQHEYGLFVQDSWKVRPNLTLEIGLRYELDQPPVERNGNLSNLLNQQPYGVPPITFQTVGPGTGREIFYGYPYNFEPRVGLAWDPFHDGKTSFRAGYGIFHDRVFGNLFTNLKGNPPFVAGVQNFPNQNYPREPGDTQHPAAARNSTGAFRKRAGRILAERHHYSRSASEDSADAVLERRHPATNRERHDDRESITSDPTRTGYSVLWMAIRRFPGWWMPRTRMARSR